MIVCHDCAVGIVGCSGSTSWPTGRPFEDPPIFHCPRCTEKHLVEGSPCGTVQVRLEAVDLGDGDRRDEGDVELDVHRVPRALRPEDRRVPPDLG